MYNCYPLSLWSLYSSKTSMTCSKYVARSVIHFSTVALEKYEKLCALKFKNGLFFVHESVVTISITEKAKHLMYRSLTME